MLTILVACCVDSTFAISVVPPAQVAFPDINRDPISAIAAIIKYALLLTSVLAVMAITW